MYNYSNYNQNDYAMPNDNQSMMPIANPNMYPVPNIAPGYSQNIANSYDGFIRGNMFTDLYDPYIPSEPFALAPQDEREALLNKVRECNFAALDLNLYLDTHPDDAEKIKAFNQCATKAKQMTEEYESKYGPLTLRSEALNAYPWAWLMSPWPWEVR